MMLDLVSTQLPANQSRGLYICNNERGLQAQNCAVPLYRV